MSQATAAPIVVGETRGRVKWIRFNRPEVRNAIALESADLAREQVEAAEAEGARVIVLSGSGGSFCAGADLKSLSANFGTVVDVRQILRDHYHKLLLALTGSPLPVIAAVDGPAAGIGCDIALGADLRLVSEKAFFAQNFVNIGLMPDGGGTFTLPRLVGTARAMEMALTGLRVSAAQALQWGLVNYVYPTAGFEDAVQKFAETLAEKAPLSLARSKRAIRAGLEGGTFQQALELEADLQQELIQTEDFPEGVMAFLSKRTPEFKGR